MTPTPRPSVPQAELERLRTAFAELDSLDSYGWRFTGTPSVVLGEVVGTVVNRDPFRMRYDINSGGEVAGSAIFVGDQAWQSVSGGPFRHDPDLTIGIDDPLPFEPTFTNALDAVSSIETLGEETVVTGPALHLRATAETGPRRFRGAIDIWIDIAQEFLVRAELTGVTPRESDRPRESPTILGASVTIDRVNDPGNSVSPPL